MKILQAALTILYTIFIATLTVALTIKFSLFTSADASSSMVVRTGHRTRDWTAPNAYSMHSLNEDHHTRLYSCMQQVGVKKVGDVEFRTTLDGFRQDAKAFHNCGLESDRGWPRDLGFLRCLQRHFKLDYHQSNQFLQCLDLSEGFMVESIQPKNSVYFMGSFNFVALLLASLAVITSFLIFTAGGAWTYYDGKNHQGIRITKEGHLSGYWQPLSAFNTNVALVWSIVMFFVALYYTYPMNNTWSDIPAEEGKHAFPSTPWGGYLCSLVFLAMTAFFFSYYFEWLLDNTDKTKGEADDDKKKSSDEKILPAIPISPPTGAVIYSEPATRAIPQIPAANFVPTVVPQIPFVPHAGPPARDLPKIPVPIVVPQIPFVPGHAYASPAQRPEQHWDAFPWSSQSGGPSTTASTSNWGSFQSAGSQPFSYWSQPSSQSSKRGGPSSTASSSWGSFISPPSQSVSSWPPQSSQSSQPPQKKNRRAHSFTTRFTWNPYTRLGIIADTQKYYDYKIDAHPTHKIIPFINKAFPCTWILADSLLFVGMLNKQNSLLTENVAMVCYYIFLCRAFQFTAALFMDRVVFEQEESNQTHKKHHPNIVASCCQLCSLWCYAVVMLHFLNSFNFAVAINSLGIGNQTHALQISFVFFMTGLEAARHLLLFWTVLWGVKLDNFSLFTRIIYLLDCVTRTVFIFSACMAVPDHLGEQNSIIYSYLKLKTA